jgi:hypothetical protein
MIKYSTKSFGWPSKRDLEDLLESELRTYIGSIFRYAVRFSPVYTGSFRASWRVALSAPDHSMTTGGSPQNPLPGAEFEWPPGYKLGYSVVISNNQPYAELIEYGHLSDQAPQGVLRLAIASAR